MRLGIDASNLRGGGGITHLVQLLDAADPCSHGFQSVVLWAAPETLRQVSDKPWLEKRDEPALLSSYPRRALWQARRLEVLARRERCDLLFVPGGVFATSFRPIVTMSRNLLPFQVRELLRYGLSLMTVRLLLLRITQTRSFRRASGTIFLTRYARGTVLSVTGGLRGANTIIPHGIDAKFFAVERPIRTLADRTVSDPLRIVYVSIIDVYKHQWHVATAVAALREKGLPVSLQLIGPSYPPALKRLQRVMRRLDPQGAFISYEPAVPHEQLPSLYGGADIAVFASSCENMPNILAESMAAAMPLVCSNRGCMPEILGDAGRYFDPEDPATLAAALRELIDSPALRERLACSARERVRSLSWERCARDTFVFLAEVVARSRTHAVVT
jgi:glycosyltransferase involved in cell wall biosynthesis